MAPSNSIVNGLSRRKKFDTAGFLPPLVSLKCHLCSSYLNDPVTLPCLHSFCKSCLEKYNHDLIIKQNELRRLQRSDSVESNESEKKNEELGNLGMVICPICVDVLNLPAPNEPQVPFENSRLARIVNLVHESNVVCQNCLQATSELKCTICNSWLCVACREATHSAPIFANHEMIPLSHAEMMALPKCSTHPNNDLEFFSTEEEVGVCQVCLLKGDFVGKPYCLVSDVRKARQHEIERGIKIVLDEKERLLTGQDKMEAVLDNLDKKLETQIDAVKENFRKIREALEAREKETLVNLAALKDAKANALKEQITQSQHILNVINDGVENVRLVLNHSNDLELVYLTIVLQEFVSELSKMNFGFPDESHVEFYHNPVVDANLPVLLSDKIATLVSAYAPVPRATMTTTTNIKGKSKGDVVEKAGTNATDDKKGKEEKAKSEKKMQMRQITLTQEQQKVLEEVGANAKQADEYGCSVM